MSKLQIFQHRDFGRIEAALINGKEMFGATQVAKALGYANPHDAINRHCKQEGVVFHEVLTDGGMQRFKFISEGNMYRLITRSKLPESEKFESWIFDDVIPSIRKHGAYMTPDTLQNALNNPDTMIQILTRLKDEQAARAAAEAKIEADKPLVLFAESLQISEDSILVADLAKLLKQNGIDMGEVRLFRYLRENGYLIKNGSEYNMPTQRSMEMKLMEIKMGHRGSSDGTVKITRTPKITGKGQLYFINKFLKNKSA